MGNYILNTVNYDYKTLNHEGFGGVCKYIATPKSAAAHLNMDADDLRPSYMQTMERFCKVTEAQVAELTDVLSDIYPMGLIVYYEEYIKLLQAKIKTYIATM